MIVGIILQIVMVLVVDLGEQMNVESVTEQVLDMT